MSFKLSDSTVSTQRLAIDNSANVELGAATPSASLSVSGRPILSGSDLAQRVAAPPAMSRVTGAVTVGDNTAGSVVTVSCPTAFGLGVVGGGGGIFAFNASLNQFSIYSYDTAPATLSYGVL